MAQTANNHEQPTKSAEQASWSAIVAQAAKVLSPAPPGRGEPAGFAYDRALRLVRHIDALWKLLPEDQRPPRLDLTRVAALFSWSPDATAPARAPAADDAAELAVDHLKKFFSETDLEMVAGIIRESHRKDARLPEARLLSDALALEDVGLIGMWNQMRSIAAKGRSLEHFIRLWKTQQEYGYWEARLRDSFYFAESQQVAQQRLAEMAPIYARLAQQQEGRDVAITGGG